MCNNEASTCMSAAGMRGLFVIILTSCNPVSPVTLWDAHKDCMSDDFAWKRKHENHIVCEGMPPVDDSDINRALFDLQEAQKLHMRAILLHKQ